MMDRQELELFIGRLSEVVEIREPKEINATVLALILADELKRVYRKGKVAGLSRLKDEPKLGEPPVNGPDIDGH